MRILFISSLYPNPRQPYANAHNRQLIAALAGHAEVRVIAPVPWFLRGGIPLRIVHNGIEVLHPAYWYTPRVLRHLHWKMYRASVVHVFLKTLKQWQPDHVILGFAYPDAAALAGSCRQTNVPYSVRVNGSDVLQRIKQPRFRRIVTQTLHEAPLVFCPGESLRHAIIEACATDVEAGSSAAASRRIIAFRNGFDSALFYPLEQSHSNEGPRTILFVGNLQPVKGADLLIPAFAQAFSDADKNKESVRLVIIGDGRLRGMLQWQAKQMRVTERVEFRGPQPHAAVAEAMRHAACLCIPSRSEGMPNVVIEALACGLPVAGSAAALAAFSVDKKQPPDGLYIASDIIELPEALRAATNSSIMRTEIARSVSGYTWDAAARCIWEEVAPRGERERRA